MKREKILELNGVEYVVELNRNSALQLDKYSNLQKSFDKINENVVDYVEDIKDDENPFEDEEALDKSLERLLDKEKSAIDLMNKGFWLWLYPKNKFSLSEVAKLTEKDFQDVEKAEYLGEKYGEFFKESLEIQELYVKEQKNLKTLTNK